MIKLLAKKKKNPRPIRAWARGTTWLKRSEKAAPSYLKTANARQTSRAKEDTSLTQATQGRLQSLSTRARTKRTLSAEVTAPTTSRQGVYNIDNRRIISHLRGKVKRKRKKISKIRRKFFNFFKKAIDKRAFSWYNNQALAKAYNKTMWRSSSVG